MMLVRRRWLFLTVILQHLFFFLAQAVNAPLAYFIEDPVNFLLLTCTCFRCTYDRLSNDYCEF